MKRKRQRNVTATGFSMGRGKRPGTEAFRWRYWFAERRKKKKEGRKRYNSPSSGKKSERQLQGEHQSGEKKDALKGGTGKGEWRCRRRGRVVSLTGAHVEEHGVQNTNGCRRATVRDNTAKEKSGFSTRRRDIRMGGGEEAIPSRR